MKYENKEFCGHTIRQRSDGYLNATDMCKANGKLYGHWYQLNSTSEYLKELSDVIKIPIDKLIEIRRGGKCTEQGTWVHRRVAINMAQWISPKFSVAVSSWIEEWIQEGNHHIFTKEIENLKPMRSIQKEHALQIKYKDLLNATTEVETPAGYIDLLTDSQIIEIKSANNWKHGVGQLICYGSFYENHKKYLYLFDHIALKNDEKACIEKICQNNNIICKYI